MHKSLLFICLVLLVTSCEDHKINLAKEQLYGAWTVYKYEKEGVDITTTFTTKYVNYVIDFDKVKNYNENYLFLGVTPVAITGIYLFSDEGKILTWSDENQSRVYNVITLNDTAMTLEDIRSEVSEIYYLDHI